MFLELKGKELPTKEIIDFVRKYNPVYFIGVSGKYWKIPHPKQDEYIGMFLKLRKLSPERILEVLPLRNLVVDLGLDIKLNAIKATDFQGYEYFYLMIEVL